MATVLDTLKKGTEYLAKHGVEDARLNMQYLLAHVLKCNRMQIYVDFDRELTEPQLGALRTMTLARAKGQPLQHLLGTTEFFGLEFKTDQRALIPRPETEELTELCSKLPLPPEPKILDLGCGSGVIGLSLARLLAERHPDLVLADISPEALELAEENRKALVPDAKVRLVQSDLFSNLPGAFHLIVANLPYIPNSEQTQLSREVQKDPPVALYGGETGTEIILRLIDEAESHLETGGVLALEFGLGQEEIIKSAIVNKKFDNIQVLRDLRQVYRFLFAAKL